MKLSNTLTRNIDELTPLDGKTVRIYSCGPTVYDHAHIGNLSAYVFADTLRRVVKASGYDVQHVMNFTDVDDKTIRRSQEGNEADPKTALRELTDRYIQVFLDDMQSIGVDTSAIQFLRATDFIEQMKALITDLHQKGFAYIADDGVYFSIEQYRLSGKKYGQLLEITVKNTSEARIQNDEYDKESVHDFALWKKAKPGEPSWEFTLDDQDLTGRPGWHIECSVMSREGLGQPFDIHTGGVDLIFPHHENEIAQSTAGHDDPVMAQFFAHNDHILVDGKKMSKSAQNFHTLADVVKQKFPAKAFRLLVLQAHYQSQVNFTWESLEAAANRLKDYQAMADLRFQPITDESAELKELDYEQYKQDILEVLGDNLNTPQALALVSHISNERHTSIHYEELEAFKDLLTFLDDVLGLGLLESQDITDQQKALISQRQAAREAKDWATSDELRNELQKQGVGVRDTEYGPVWFRI